MRKLLTKLLVLGMVMALVISTIPVYGLHERVSAATTDKPEKPTIKTYTNGPGTGTGYMDISWKAMPGATNYKIVISNGYNYEYFTTGNVTTWSTKGKKIFPTQAEISQGLYKFHADGKGVEFATDPRALYENGYKAGSTHGLRNQQKYIVAIIPVYSTTDGVRSDIVDAYLPAEVQPEKAIAKTYSNGAGTGTGYIDLSWKAMPGATGYKVVIGNGYNYEYFTVGNVTSWSTKGKNIFPTKAELDKGLYRFHTDGKGTEFANDPTQLYENTYKAGTTWVLRGQKKYLIRVMATYAAGDGVTSDITEATMPIEQMSAPTLESYKIETDPSKGYMNLSWKAVPEAISYKVGFFNGFNYQYVNVGKVTNWSTKGKKIWATDEEIAAGKYQLHLDGTGGELPMDPIKTYTAAYQENPSVNYSDRLFYYTRIIATLSNGETPASETKTISMPYGEIGGTEISAQAINSENGYLDFYWDSVESAKGYKVWIFDGLNYQSYDAGNISSWTTKDLGIWPTTDDVKLGIYDLHKDSLGTDLSLKPSEIYGKKSVSYAQNQNYYSRVTAYDDKNQTIAVYQSPAIEIKEEIVTEIPDNIIEEIDPYVSLEDNEFVLSSEGEELLTGEEKAAVEKLIQENNYLLEDIDTDVSTYIDGNTLVQETYEPASDGIMLKASKKYISIKYTWWGAQIYFSSRAVTDLNDYFWLSGTVGGLGASKKFGQFLAKKGLGLAGRFLGPISLYGAGIAWGMSKQDKGKGVNLNCVLYVPATITTVR